MFIKRIKYDVMQGKINALEAKLSSLSKAGITRYEITVKTDWGTTLYKNVTDYEWMTSALGIITDGKATVIHFPANKEVIIKEL